MADWIEFDEMFDYEKKVEEISRARHNSTISWLKFQEAARELKTAQAKARSSLDKFHEAARELNALLKDTPEEFHEELKTSEG